MKAPETIFLHGYSFDDEPCKSWTLEPVKRGLRGHAVQNEKYIRKDALLEWVKKEMGEWSSESNTAQGVKMGLTLVLDKIESL